MSGLSGYDGEAVGFDSVIQDKRNETDSSTQTTEYSESGVASQTTVLKEIGSLAIPANLNTDDDVTKEYLTSGLHAFLQKVVPAMLDQLNLNDKESLCNSSDSDEEDILTTKLFQEIKLTDLPGLGGGDESRCVLDLCWSSAGNSLAVSVGQNQHENWCTDDGLIRIFTVKRTGGDIFIKNFDLTEKSCISVVKYHPTVAALLAYGTNSGEVVLCNLQDLDAIFTSHASFHGSKRVTALQWADTTLANIFLIMHIVTTGKRRNASDHILLSSGSDGTINVWQVNATTKTFENVISYCINGSRKMAALNITCFDFVKTFPLRPCDQKVAEDIFVVGSNTGALFLCKAKSFEPIVDSKAVDPVYEALDGHRTCILNVMFSSQKPGVFVSASIDSEIRIYNVNQTSPLKIMCIDVPISCASWLPNNPWVVVVGVAKPKGQLLRVYNACSGRPLPVDGFVGAGACVTAIAVNHSGVCRIAAGDSESNIRIWELPSRRIKLSTEELDF